MGIGFLYRYQANADIVITDPTAPFRFTDSPGEIKNKVYTLLLCSFGTPPDRARDHREAVSDDHPIAPDPITISRMNGTAMLRTNSQTHREAYDIMVITNRCIRLSSLGALPLEVAIAAQDVPILVAGPGTVQFEGYVQPSCFALLP
jgi:hypothetical protein